MIGVVLNTSGRCFCRSLTSCVDLSYPSHERDDVLLCFDTCLSTIPDPVSASRGQVFCSPADDNETVTCSS